MTSLHKWSDTAYKRVDRAQPQDTVFWLCFLALNQHRKGEEVGASPEEGPFNAALMQAKGAVMILDEQVNPFSRIWCLFEVKRLTDLKKEFELICSFGSVASLLDGSTRSSQDMTEVTACVQQIGDALEKVSAHAAKASSEADKLAIWHRVADPAFRRMPLERARLKFADASFRRFDMTMRSLLAQPLFQANMRCADFEKALRYIGLGAAFGDADLELLQHSIDVRTVQVSVKSGGSQSVMWTLLHCAAFFGHLEAVDSLLRRKADMEESTSFGYAALHHASRNGHVAITSFLLERNAQIVSKRGLNALGNSVHQGYAEVVDILLQARASANARERNETPLGVATVQGHLEVVKVLLAHKADVLASTADGSTALHLATQDNHVAVVEALLGDSPQAVRRKTQRGLSALDLAEQKGHNELADRFRSVDKMLPEGEGSGVTPGGTSGGDGGSPDRAKASGGDGGSPVKAKA
eukprot:CAMPEP_0183528058 /NCGR_PEP_ID=MMETSP0371-20130417/22465_1 /TAXON_ID=268820 /ORGANISM="Peridinium aciculiferum, Strain PAER-2" /LENGTH=468 /DNA_ID=CAMNT_0025727621 /DNA_START=39 /DNA_END=1441 /DNA_ORIENTATION=+